jgi:ribosomal protein S2
MRLTDEAVDKINSYATGAGFGKLTVARRKKSIEIIYEKRERIHIGELKEAIRRNGDARKMTFVQSAGKQTIDLITERIYKTDC